MLVTLRGERVNLNNKAHSYKAEERNIFYSKNSLLNLNNVVIKKDRESVKCKLKTAAH